MKTSVLFLAVLLCSCAAKKPLLGDSPSGQKLAPLAFLVGDWDGQGTGAGGTSIGSLTLAPDLQTNVLVRRGFNLNGTQVHEDLTIIYLQGNDIRADYFDSEGHIIRYQVYPQPQTKQVVFESNPGADGNQYRLSYRPIDDDTVEMKFDVGHAGSDFQPYLNGTLKRKKK